MPTMITRRSFQARPLCALALLGWMACGGDPEPGINDAGGSDVPMTVDAGVDKAPDTATPSDGVVVVDSGGPVDVMAAVDAGDDLPAQCRVAATTLPQPFQVTFRFKNAGATPVYLHQGCTGLDFAIASCGSRYTDSVGPRYACACRCEDSTCIGSVACGPCPPPSGIPVAPGATQEMPWIATLITPEERPTYTCNHATHLPAARYSVSVPLFATADAAAAGQPVIRTASRTFDLPASGGIVEVALVDQPADAGVPIPASCSMQPEQPPAVCKSPWDPALVCALDSTYTLGMVGGNALWSESAVVTPIGKYTITRESVRTPTQPPISCTSQLPLCGSDHATFTSADLMEALSAADVIAAFGPAPFKVHGGDARAYDGQVLQVARADGQGFMVGTSCGNTGRPCSLPLTKGLQHVADVFDKIDQQQRATPACAVLRTAP
jgi:hypothetical protein